MPHIKPFSGIYPAQEHIERVITTPPDLPLDKAAWDRLAENPDSFLHLVTPPLGNEFLQGSRDALVYRQAAENLQAFLERRILLKEKVPCLYLYSVEGAQTVQTGIWTVTLFDDYLNNRIRKHEYTRPERESGIAEYIRQTGIDANPVLIAYPAQEEIDRLTSEYLLQDPMLSFSKDGKRHALRRIDSALDIETLVDCFENLPSAYLADGHHRAAALSSYGVERRKFNFRHTGQEEYNFFSSIYFSAETLEIKAFNRLVKDLNGLSVTDFLDKLSRDFQVQKTTVPPVAEPGRFGMYLSGQWYLLLPLHVPDEATAVPAEMSQDRSGKSRKEQAQPDRESRASAAIDPVKALDVTMLQERILAPLLGIDDPRTNERIRFCGGSNSPEALAREVDNGAAAVLFSLYPTSIHQLMAVADAGLVMPPKSTWFEPKLDLGILTHYIV